MRYIQLLIARFFFGEINESISKSLRLVLSLVKEHQYFLLLLLSFGVIVGFIEGASIGLIAYSAVVLTGQSEHCPAIVEKILSYTPLELCQDYDKYRFFLYLIYGSIIVQVLKSLIIYASGYLGIILKTRVAYEMKRKVIDKMMGLDFQSAAKIPTGEKELIFRSSLKVSNLVIVVNQIIVTLCVLGSYILLLVGMNLKLSLLSAVLILFLLFVVSPVLGKIRDVSLQVRKNSKVMNKKIIDYMFAMRLIKVFGRHKEASEDLDLTIRKEVGFFRKSASYSLVLEPLQETVTILSIGIMLLFSFYSAGSSIESFLPATLAYVLVLHKCNSRITVLNTIRAAFAKSMAGVQYVSDFLTLEEKNIERGSETIQDDWSSICVDNVSFKYDGHDRDIVQNLNFEIKKGQVVAFVGESGAGKSTIVDILIGLFRPTSGSISIGGISSFEASDESWLKQFSMVSQNDLILNGTIKNNLLFSNLKASEEEIIKACEIAQADHFIEKLEKGYDTNLGEMGSSVSGGQLQRITLARALLKQAPILILDEATSAMDTITEQKVVKSLNHFFRDKTIIMIAHRLTTVMNADIIFVMESGKIIDQGSHEDLLLRSDKYQKMWNQ